MTDFDFLKNEFVPKYISAGEGKFYKFLLTYSLNKFTLIKNGEFKGASPEIELLNYSEDFLTLYRREDEKVFLDISKVFRKAAHKIYRFGLKSELTTYNSKFLNLVENVDN